MNMITERYRDAATSIYSDGTTLVYERIFDAPRDVVWQAFMDPDRIPRWWGPHGTTTTVVEMDVRVGGTWRYVSRAPDRDDVTFHGEYIEIVPPERFTWTFLFDVPGVGPQGRREPDTKTRSAAYANGRWWGLLPSQSCRSVDVVRPRAVASSRAATVHGMIEACTCRVSATWVVPRPTRSRPSTVGRS